MSDIEVVALSITAEYMSTDSENSLFEKLKEGSIENLLERSQVNKIRRNLFELTEKIRKKLSVKFIEHEDYFIIDSMPLEVCKFSRHYRSRICKENFDTAPAKGYLSASLQFALFATANI